MTFTKTAVLDKLLQVESGTLQLSDLIEEFRPQRKGRTSTTDFSRLQQIADSVSMQGSMRRICLRIADKYNNTIEDFASQSPISFDQVAKHHNNGNLKIPIG
jgi:hypothetical protein